MPERPRARSGARPVGSEMATHAAPDAARARAPASLADERTPMLLAQARDTLEAYASASPRSRDAGLRGRGARRREDTRWRAVLTAAGALGTIGACAAIARPYLVHEVSGERTAARASEKTPASSGSERETEGLRLRRHHRNARAARFAAEAAAYEAYEAAVGSRVARVFAPYPDAAPWRDSSAGSNAFQAEVSATDEVWSARIAAAASLLGVPARESSLNIPRPGDDPDAIDTKAKYEKVKAWSFSRYEPSWTGAYRTYGPAIGGAQLSYFSIYKAANNNIRHSIAVMSEEEEDALNGTEATTLAAAAAKFAASLSGDSRPNVGRREDESDAPGDAYRCKFTFLRDPLERFVSAYAEFEYRVSPEFEQHFPSTCAQGDWVTNTFDLLDASDREMVSKTAPGESLSLESSESLGKSKPLDSDSLWSSDSPVWPPPLGSAARARLLLRLLASLRWVDDSREARARLNAANDPVPAKTNLNCVVAFHHFFPQANNFVSSSPDASSPASRKRQTPLNFVGKLERFSEDWSSLAETCRVTPPEALRYAPLPDGGGHPTTSGAPTEDAMLALLESDDDAMVAFCLLYLDDYTWGGYELPRACAVSDVVRRLTTAYEVGDAVSPETPSPEAGTVEAETDEVAAEEGEAERAETPKQSFAQYVRSHFAAPREEEEEEEALPFVL